MDAFDIYVDSSTSGRVMAHLLEPPGLGVRFDSREVMRARLPRMIAAHLAWMRSHGERTPGVRPDKYRIAAEVFVAGDFQSGDDVGFYPPDAVSVSDDEVERYLRFAGFAHEDMLALVQGLNDAVLDWTRDPRVRTIRQILLHVVGAELWYMSRIIDDPRTHGMPGILDDANLRIDATPDAVERLRIVWRAFQLWARSLTPDLRSRITVPAWFTERKSEQWSARKMLRRCIEHCREHTRSVQQILTAHHSTGPSTR